jgi:hypothetical protein
MEGYTGQQKSWLKQKYNLSLDDFEALLRKQGNRCAICFKSIEGETLGGVRRANVDHDHATGKVRGLLCTGCNTALGKFEDSIRLLAAAIVYLQEHEESK